jgi:hypothetical protein
VVTVSGAPPSTPILVVTPPGLSDSAHPACAVSSHREITHCSRLAAKVGQTRAVTVIGPGVRRAAAASTRT